MAQTCHPQVHQPDTMFVWMKPLLMHKKNIKFVDKSGPLTAVRNLMGEFHGIKIAKENGRQRKKTAK